MVNNKMKKISLEELKEIELNLLLQIDKICRDNNIKYSLSGGTLLGAIRHKGFIPWDDDIDVVMPREDYNKFISYCENNNIDFKIINFENNKYYYHLFTKAYAPNTIIKEVGDNRIHKDNYGVYLDIFPYDGLSGDYGEACIKSKKLLYLKSLLSYKYYKKYIYNHKLSIIKNIYMYLTFLNGKITPKNVIYKKIFNMLKCSTYEYFITIDGYYGTKEIIKKTIFDELIDVEFEGNKFLSFKNYDKYLKNLYGDYMALPPKEKQITHHTFDAYYIYKLED